MSRIELLILFGIWLYASAAATGRLPTSIELAEFGGGFVAVVAVLAVWGWRVRNGRPGRFLRTIWIGRQLVVIWFAVGVFTLHWAQQVNYWIGPLFAGPEAKFPLESIPAMVGTMPALLAWIGIAACRYPVDRDIREETVLIELDEGFPVHPLGGLRAYLSANLRLDLLFTLVPIGLILVCQDLGATALRLMIPHEKTPEWAEPAISLSAAGIVFVLAPLLLTRVLKTRTLPPSPLRERLETMCRQAGLKYRDILLWHTDNHVGNAAVMGVLPQVRYILLSDLLLESMSDEQIEAVFAHELGHVVHKHLSWMGVFVVILLLGSIGPWQWVDHYSSTHLPGWVADMLLPVISGAGALLLLLGGLSPFFERQADVFAARMIESHHRREDPAAKPGAVGSYGANLFASALHRVAIINGIPIHARNLSHGSIAGRIDHLHRLSADPNRTSEFDRRMLWIYVALLSALVTFAVWSVIILIK